MWKRIAIISVCLNIISASFDYMYDNVSFLGM